MLIRETEYSIPQTLVIVAFVKSRYLETKTFTQLTPTNIDTYLHIYCIAYLLY